MTVGFLSSGSIGMVVRNLRFIRSSAGPYPISVGVVLHAKKLSTYVTGYWKTDHNVTLGQLHFIGPANSHTHALSMH